MADMHSEETSGILIPVTQELLDDARWPDRSALYEASPPKRRSWWRRARVRLGETWFVLRHGIPECDEW